MGAELMWTCPHFLLSITESYWMCFVEETGLGSTMSLLWKTKWEVFGILHWKLCLFSVYYCMQQCVAVYCNCVHL